MAHTDHQTIGFVDYMKSLQTREKVVKEIAKATSSSVTSVYRWINGQVVPPPLKQQIIADYFKVPVESIFPDYERR